LAFGLRFLAFAPTVVLPIISAWVSLLMWPLVLGNSPYRLSLILILIASPVASFAALTRLERPWTYGLALSAVLIGQLLIESIINRWFG